MRILAPFMLALLCAPLLHAADDYKPGPDAMEKPGVPRGKVTEHVFDQSKVFEGTIRKYHIYVPAQCDGKSAANLMVFQDGHAYVNPKGDFRVPTVFDNLIAAGEMPVTIGVFIDPGDKASVRPAKPATQPWKASNRSVEYDTLSDAYARFLIEEILPEAQKTANVKFTDDPAGRAICGMSSGGICAWTVAWERPDSFGKVVSHIGSFTNIRGGHVYPALIRKTPKKPIKVFLQDGKNDLDNQFGNWYLANLEMEAALKFSKYDYKAEWGEGAHNGKHAGSIFPDTMRWLWKK